MNQEPNEPIVTFADQAEGWFALVEIKGFPPIQNFFQFITNPRRLGLTQAIILNPKWESLRQKIVELLDENELEILKSVEEGVKRDMV